jgi:hypothetical protein
MEQLSLFNDDYKMRKKRESLSRTVDTIRAQLGTDAIKRGSHG